MIVPGILETKFEEVVKKIKLIEADTKQIHLDIADNKLVHGETFLNLDKINELKTTCEIEVHFMVVNPEEMVKQLPNNVKYVVSQVEVKTPIEAFINNARERNFIVGISLNTSTNFMDFENSIKLVDYVQFMSVEPGSQGNLLNNKVIEQIKNFKKVFPRKSVQIDGGVNLSTIELLDKLGLDKIVVGSGIFNSKDPDIQEKKLSQIEMQNNGPTTKAPYKPPKNKRKVAFLGGASFLPSDETFKDAYLVALKLAESGYEIVNGGGPGVMRASTLGAKAGGQKEVYVVTYHINGPHKNYEGNDANNPYDEEILTLDYFDRTKVMLQNTDIHIVFKGGTGTISEFGMTWASSRIHEGHHKPIILYGSFWNDILASIKAHMLMRPGELELVKVCTTPQEVLDYIDELSKIITPEHSD